MPTFCSRPFTLNVTEGDTPLDQCVYCPAAGARAAFIAGVRGGYVFKFDPTTGAKISQSRFSSQLIANCSITYEPVNDKVIISAWNEGTDLAGGASGTGKGVFKINPSTLALEFHQTVLPAWQAPAFGGFQANRNFYDLDDGFGTVTNYGGMVYGLGKDQGSSNWFLYSYNPTTDDLKLFDSQTVGFSGWTNIIVLSPTIFITGCSDIATIDFFSLSVQTQLSFLPFTIGSSTSNQDFCKAPSGSYYVVDRSSLLYKVDSGLTAAVNFSIGALNTGAQHCRINSVDSLIYIPTPASNSVVVFDPSTDTVLSTKTGFDSPHDIVFTPTKKWCVQLGGTGLKEII